MGFKIYNNKKITNSVGQWKKVASCLYLSHYPLDCLHLYPRCLHCCSPYFLQFHAHRGLCYYFMQNANFQPHPILILHHLTYSRFVFGLCSLGCKLHESVDLDFYALPNFQCLHSSLSINITWINDWLFIHRCSVDLQLSHWV